MGIIYGKKKYELRSNGSPVSDYRVKISLEKHDDFLDDLSFVFECIIDIYGNGTETYNSVNKIFRVSFKNIHEALDYYDKIEEKYITNIEKMVDDHDLTEFSGYDEIMPDIYNMVIS